MKRWLAMIGLLLAVEAYAGHPGNGYLGVGVAGLEKPGSQGIEIRDVDEDSPAAKAGFKDGDVVLSYNGRPVGNVEQFVRLVRDTPAGRTVRLQIMRGGATQNLTATIGARKAMWSQDGPDFPDVPTPPMPAMPSFFHQTGAIGIDAQPVSGQLAEYFGVKAGVLVVSVVRESPGQKAGLKAGDVITRVNGDPVSSPHEITGHIRPSKPLAVVAVRNHHEMSLEIAF